MNVHFFCISLWMFSLFFYSQAWALSAEEIERENAEIAADNTSPNAVDSVFITTVKSSTILSLEGTSVTTSEDKETKQCCCEFALKFASANFEKLGRDLAYGEGEHLRSFEALLRFSDSEKSRMRLNARARFAYFFLPSGDKDVVRSFVQYAASFQSDKRACEIP